MIVISDAPKADSRLVIELSNQVSQLIGEVEALEQKMSKYEDWEELADYKKKKKEDEL